MAGPTPEDAVNALSRLSFEETELVRRAQLGSVAAFERLVVDVGPSVHRYLAMRLRHDSDARDALQETFVAVWQGLSSLQQPSKFRPWVFGIAARKGVDAKRRRSFSSERDLEAQGYEDGAETEIRGAILALPAHLRDVLLLRHLLGFSEEEVAEALGIRLGTVKSRSARARQALAELLR